MAEVELSAELKAMVAVERALTGVAGDVQQRVLRWACERFGIQGVPLRADKKRSAQGEEEEGDENGDGGNAPAGGGLAEFYDRAAPETDTDKALVMAYWYQYKEGQSEVEAQRVNKELKHLGYRVGNITRAFEGLKGQKPALIVQTRKEGTTKQARKKYKVTGEGKKVVEKMLAAKKAA